MDPRSRGRRRGSGFYTFCILIRTSPGGLPSIRSHRVGYDGRDLAAAAAFPEEENPCDP